MNRLIQKTLASRRKCYMQVLNRKLLKKNISPRIKRTEKSKSDTPYLELTNICICCQMAVSLFLKGCNLSPRYVRAETRRFLKKYNLEIIIPKQKAMQKRDDTQIKREFWLRQGRQFLAIAAALFLVLLPAIVYKRHDLFGEYPKNSLVAAQLMVITAFIGFTAFNWRCPSCKKYLGSDIFKRGCRHCKTHLR